MMVDRAEPRATDGGTTAPLGFDLPPPGPVSALACHADVLRREVAGLRRALATQPTGRAADVEIGGLAASALEAAELNLVRAERLLALLGLPS